MTPKQKTAIRLMYDLAALPPDHREIVEAVMECDPADLTDRERATVDAVLEPVRRSDESEPPADPSAVGSTAIDNTRPATAVALEFWTRVFDEGNAELGGSVYGDEDRQDVRVQPLGTRKGIRLAAVGSDRLGYLGVLTDGTASERSADILESVADARKWCLHTIRNKSAPADPNEPHRDDVYHLEVATIQDDWPARWMTVSEYVSELDRRGAWAAIPVPAAERMAWLDDLFNSMWNLDEDGKLAGAVWCRIGDTYRHHDLVQTAEEWEAVGEDWKRRMRERFGNDE